MCELDHIAGFCIPKHEAVFFPIVGIPGMAEQGPGHRESTRLHDSLGHSRKPWKEVLEEPRGACRVAATISCGSPGFGVFLR